MKNNQIQNIPEELKQNELFCIHQNKIPLAKTNDKTTFKTFNQVINEMKEGQGVGIGLFDSLCGIDIDHCIDHEGNLSATAKDIIETIDSYCEKSLSGTGVHILFKCNNQEKLDSDSYYTKNSEKGIEIYQGNYDNRFFTMTGDKIQGNVKVVDFSEVKKVLNKYNKKNNKPIQKNNIINLNDTTEDEDYLKIGLQKDTKLQELWNSTPSGSGGNESETDLKLLNKLAYWSNCNEYLMRKYFEESPYYIAKDNQHKKKWEQRKDYSKNTIANAIKNTSSTARQDNQRFNESQRKEFLDTTTRKEKENKSDTIKKGSEEIIQELNSKSIINNIESFFQKSEKGQFKPISTGFKNFDSIINGGLQKQSLVVIGGGSSMGKTTFTINLALNLLKQNKKVIYYSLEMSEEQIQAKVFSNIAYTTGGKQISSDRFFNLYDTNTMTEASKKQILEMIKSRTELQNLFVIHQSNLLDEIKEKVEEINNAIRETESESPILIVDYLQYLQGKTKEDTQSLIKRATAFFKDYAIKNDTIVIVLTANNRESTKEKQRTMFSGGRDSSDIEYSSDYNLQINFAEWEEYQGNNRESELHSLNELKNQNPKEISFTLHKARMGQSGKMMKFSFNGITNTFEEINEEETTNYKNDSSFFSYRKKQI